MITTTIVFVIYILLLAFVWFLSGAKHCMCVSISAPEHLNSTIVSLLTTPWFLVKFMLNLWHFSQRVLSVKTRQIIEKQRVK